MSEKWPVSEALGLRRLLERAGGSTYRVRVRNLLLPCSIGIHEHERRRTQRVRINVELDVADPGPFSSEDFSEVLNYETIVSGTRTIVDAGHIELVETLAERIAGICLADPRSVSVTVGVKKLHAYSESERVARHVIRQRGA